MPQNFSEEKPIFLQIAERMEDAVLSGAFPEESQLPSTTEISSVYRVNPATALKGINLLVEEGVAYKRRGIGMFVSEGARILVSEKRQKLFYENYVLPLISEAKKLGLTEEKILSMTKRGYEDDT